MSKKIYAPKTRKRKLIKLLRETIERLQSRRATVLEFCVSLGNETGVLEYGGMQTLVANGNRDYAIRIKFHEKKKRVRLTAAQRRAAAREDEQTYEEFPDFN